MAHRFHPSLLREYDMRGVFGDTLYERDAHAVGRSFGTLVRRRGGSRVVIGRDGRLSSPRLESALADGLAQSGVDVLRIGIGPTPMLYYAEAVLDVDGGIQITGSHNPADHNGFKLVLAHEPFFGADITRLGSIAADGDWEEGSGRVESIDIMDGYVARLLQGFAGAPCRIGWDAGNGAAGPVIDKLVQLLPGEHHTLFTEIDGNFPHHHPDPTIEANLQDLRALVLSNNLHFGVAFDGDGDRIGVIDGRGRIIQGDQLLGLFAELVLKNRPGATIVADVKSSQALFDHVAALGGRPLMWKTGHSHIKSKMKEVGSPLGGEMTGHIMFADDYYGFDDGLYAAIRLIRAASESGETIAALHDHMPVMLNTPELRFRVEESRKFGIVEEILSRLRVEGARVDETDGARVASDSGWWLLRASNTQAELVARLEAHDNDGLERLRTQLLSQLRQSGVVPNG
ncbi:Phosphomannomutase [Sphingobium herbicidovorans NBRC 16415]|uniref:Phosphomannomutase n=1 Tax=Sphingobium herbicidovorans (strain ATCC 700291 / DSM 11019 / CCUG 56400 / KCTC 2939 / LMG 18315 / NBRC 16415 / MH) TaxID=1219045 RepID=A0A086P571_SPHHM|nr:phosphomannomutase/phosphoglucomutase [Sphingobium herbicidovorans]KFG88539.1 Phosphomannomutase [Sphingobium herbicidovorans NBRC 16415]